VPVLKPFFETSSEVQIEADGPGPGTSNAYEGDVVAALEGVAAAIAAPIAAMPEDRRPGELTVAFGLKALADGGCAITLDPDAANFRISLSWKAEPSLTSDAGVPAFPSLPQPEA
jgi:hypothetical protein